MHKQGEKVECSLTHDVREDKVGEVKVMFMTTTESLWELNDAYTWNDFASHSHEQLGIMEGIWKCIQDR